MLNLPSAKNLEREKGGFTLIELLVVIAIISLLSSVVLASLSSARASARDARRVSDFNQLRTAINLYLNDTGEYPGMGDQDMQVSESCPGTDLYQDLVGGDYLTSMPTDPAENYLDCADITSGTATDFFYAWDGDNAGGDICFVINNFETNDDGGPLAGINQQPEVNFGGEGNTGEAEFVYCFEDTVYY